MSAIYLNMHGNHVGITIHVSTMIVPIKATVSTKPQQDKNTNRIPIILIIRIKNRNSLYSF